MKVEDVNSVLSKLGTDSFSVRPWFLASAFYFSMRDEVKDLMQSWLSYLRDSDLPFNRPYLVMDSEELSNLQDSKNTSEWPLLLILSGGTQSSALHIIEKHHGATIWFLHPSNGVLPSELEARLPLMLARNAIPAIMDVWARSIWNQSASHVLVNRCSDLATLSEAISLAKAFKRVHNTRLLRVGKTESWVVSSENNSDRFTEATSIRTTQIPVKSLVDSYKAIEPTEEVKALASRYLKRAVKVIEPRIDDVIDSVRLYVALVSLLKEYKANAVAISCFSLAKMIGVTPCVAVSLINESQGTVASCEGDLDAAASLLLAKAVADRPVFMGNVIVNLDNTLDIVHCTAPISLGLDIQTEVILRSHHETSSSVGQAVRVLGTEKEATIFRLGVRARKASVVRAKFLRNLDLPTCRTQWRFSVPDSLCFLDALLGNHQVVVFGDYTQPLSQLCRTMGFDMCPSKESCCHHTHYVAKSGREVHNADV